jgi:predicted metalloprotease
MPIVANDLSPPTRTAMPVHSATTIAALAAAALFCLAPFSLTPVRAEPSPQRPGDDVGKFVSETLDDLAREWSGVFRKDGRTYGKPVLVLYSGVTEVACGGAAQSAAGPFYCAEGEKIYIHPSFLRAIENRFKGCEAGSACRFAQAYVIAHLAGHHVQNQLGILAKVRQVQKTMDREGAARLQARTELQADCLAGMWTKHENERLQHDGKPPVVETGSIEPALRAAAAAGDEAIRRNNAAHVSDSLAHANEEQRRRWFATGFRDGTVAACNTFKSAD